MLSDPNRSGTPERRGLIPGPQSLVSGLILIALALLALWLTRNLSQGTLRAMGPAMLPRSLAYGVAGCGLILITIGLLRPGAPLVRWGIRGPLMVVLAILVFAFTIRPFRFGDVVLPGFGLIVACPLGVLIGGHATPEARVRDLLVLGLALTSISMFLFGDLLNLPIPLFPQWLADMFPASFSAKTTLRVTAIIVAALAAALFFIGRRSGRQETTRVSVPDHSGTI